MGKHKDKICEDCQNKPVINGRRWADHCRSVHEKDTCNVNF